MNISLKTYHHDELLGYLPSSAAPLGSAPWATAAPWTFHPGQPLRPDRPEAPGRRMVS